jgi:hypothetical protein
VGKWGSDEAGKAGSAEAMKLKSAIKAPENSSNLLNKTFCIRGVCVITKSPGKIK